MAVLLSVCLLILAMPVYGWEEKEEITGKEADNNLITPGNYGGYTAGLKKQSTILQNSINSEEQADMVLRQNVPII